MNSDSAIIKINEIVHYKMTNYRQDVLSQSEFSGLTQNLFSYIEAVDSLKNPTLGEVAEYLDITNASASVSINKLISKGYIEKNRSNIDKRKNNLSVTAKGDSLIAANNKAIKGFVEDIMLSLTESEKEAVQGIYIKIKSLHENDRIKN